MEQEKRFRKIGNVVQQSTAVFGEAEILATRFLLEEVQMRG
jgi:hypothetical protein